MPQVCCVYGCRHNNEMCKLKRFPTDKDRSRVWESNIGQPNWKRGPYDRICQCHFDDNQWEKNRADGAVKLSPVAVPLLFPTHKITTGNLSSAQNAQDAISKTSENSIKPPGIFASIVANRPILPKVTECTDITPCISEAYSISPDQFHEIGNNISREELQRKIWRLEKDLKNTRKRLSSLQDSISSLFNEDQLTYLSKKQVIKWSKGTVEKALKIRQACGIKGYNFLLDQGWPFPSYRSLCRTEKNGN